MNLLRDKHIRYFSCFIIGYIILFFGCSTWLLSWQTDSARQMLLSRENTMISALLNQGVPEDVVAAAVANEEKSESGKAFLEKIGRGDNITVSALPELTGFREEAVKCFIRIIFVLSVFLIGGIFIFLRSRERLYQQATNTIQRYIDGDFTCHLPQNSEGSVYQLFSSMDQLATMLQARGESQHKEKEFLKGTISDISHQLKTPLAALTMYQEIIASEPDHSDTVKEFSAKMGVSLKRIKELIESMLKITRLDAGSIVFEKRYYTVYEVVRRSINELELRAKQEGKEILFEGDKDQMLSCDLEWTAEAIGNIVKNALDHTESGGVIRVSWAPSPAMVRIQIQDNGDGIPQEDLHHIFKRFYRSKKSLDTQGVGLGLPLAKAIIEGQKGVISVKSESGEGTVFTIAFLTEQ